eukprot:6199432-Pleurochrysis_carterae.AAC.1
MRAGRVVQHRSVRHRGVRQRTCKKRQGSGRLFLRHRSTRSVHKDNNNALGSSRTLVSVSSVRRYLKPNGDCRNQVRQTRVPSAARLPYAAQRRARRLLRQARRPWRSKLNVELITPSGGILQ